MQEHECMVGVSPWFDATEQGYGLVTFRQMAIECIDIWDIKLQFQYCPECGKKVVWEGPVSRTEIEEEA